MILKIKSILFENKTIKQTVFKNTFWLGVSSILGKIIRAIIIIYAARVLGASGYGVFSYALTIAATLSIFMDLGINPIILREFSRQDNESRKKYLGTASVLKLILLSFGFLIIIFVAPYFIKIKEAIILLPLVGLVLVFDILRDFILNISRALEQMQKEAFLSTLTNLAILIFGFILLNIKPSTYSLTLAYTLGTGIGSLISLWAFREYFRNIFQYFSPKLIKKILFTAWPFALSGFLSMFLTNTDILLIGWFRSAKDVGYYSAALKIIQLLYVLPGILTLALMPTFSKLANKDNERFRYIFEQGIKILFLFSLPLTFGGVILANPIIEFIFGKDYLVGASSFAVLSLTILIDFYAAILMNAIFAYNQQKYLSVYSATGAISNVLLDLILIPKFGIIGSAWATFFAQLTSNVYLWIKMKQINSFKVIPHIKKLILASILMGILAYILYYFKMPVILIILICVIFYFAFLYLIKEKIFEEIKLIFKLES